MAMPFEAIVRVSPGYTRTNLRAKRADPQISSGLIEASDTLAKPPDAVARAIAFAIEQPATIVNEIIVRSTAQT
jgi:NADP-dependent 3-hydroxy acid dehydrogenase YdfG